MLYSSLEQSVYNLVDGVLSSLGYRVVRVKVYGQQSYPTVQVMIEHDDRVTPVVIKDCSAASKIIQPSLDTSDIIDSDYNLEVSSPGVDRPLMTQQDFEYYKGREAKLQTTRLIDGRKRFKGMIGDVGTESVCINDDENNNYTVPLNLIDNARLVYDKKTMSEQGNIED